MALEKFICLLKGHSYKFNGFTYSGNYIFTCERCNKKIVFSLKHNPWYYCPRCKHAISYSLLVKQKYEDGYFTCPYCQTKFKSSIPIIDLKDDHIFLIKLDKEILI